MKEKLRTQIKRLTSQLLAQEQAFNVTAMKQTIGQLYERMAVLEYLESQLISDEDIRANQALDSKSFREENWFKEPEPVPQPEEREEIIEPLMEKIKDIVAQMPEESQKVDDLLREVLPEKKLIKNDLEEFASSYQTTPTFERKEADNIVESEIDIRVKEVAGEKQPKSINDKLHKGLNVGLNDRLAFIKHLFDGKADDYSRVLSQINSMSTFDQAEAFIKGKIKPDYNYWLNKEEYSERFMAIVEKNFN